MRSTARLLRRLRFGSDEGFSLLEAVVALNIAAAVFLSMAGAMVSATKAAFLSQQNQQAADALTQAMEQVRALPYDAIAMRASDLSTNEPLNIAGCTCYNPLTNSASGAGTEPLALDPAGGVFPHVTTVTQNHVAFTLRRYVTTPTDNVGAAYKRVTVVATWSLRGRSHTRTISSLVARTNRGLPLPDFKFVPAKTSDCRAPGAILAYEFTVKNNGARDAWSLSTTPGTPAWSWVFDNGDNVFDPSTDTTPLPTDPSTGNPSTGLLEPTGSVRFWATYTVPLIGWTSPMNVSFRATSVAQPSSSSASQQYSTTSTVQAVCPGPSPSPSPTPSPTASVPPQPTTCGTATTGGLATNNATLTDYWLNNTPQNNANTTHVQPMQIVSGLVANDSSVLWDYSTDYPAGKPGPVAGRYVNAPGSGPGESRQDYVAEWRYQFPQDTKLSGQAGFTIWAAPASLSALSPGVLTVYLDRLSSNGTTRTPLTSATVTSLAWGCAGFKPVTVLFPDAFPGGGSGYKVTALDFLSVRVEATGTAPMLLAYDTTTFLSKLTLPVKSGG